MFYLHPWEIDPDQPQIEVSVLTRFRHYNNIAGCQDRLKRLLSDFSFTTMNACLEASYADLSALPRHRYRVAQAKPAMAAL